MASKSNTFLYNVDKEEVNRLLDDTNENSKYFNQITNDVVDSYTSDLDQIMSELYVAINSGNPLDENTIESYMLRLSNIIYFLGERLETVGIKADVSKAARQEVYNRSYLDNQIKDTDRKNKTTIVENQSVAEEASKYESVIANIYERTYKVIKFKIDSANDMLGTLKKILTKRITEMDLSRFTPKQDDSVYNDIGE